ncbi:sodium:proton antiporter [Roseovarius sp. SK2]|uniref:cation:proton antiporter n=1 Tax=Roseovarius TaxID=74030 RepID=UPI00237B71B4|nr:MULTISPECIES: sodium:proton antiporter [unclassified Roseovarius]MDD9727358.1 sodium:proton antiporter [Roseovarius sp. SK2]
MATGGAEGAIDPVMAVALVGALGVGAQWVAWRLRMPAIVLMLAAGLIAGPILGIFDPARDIGTLMGPMISIAVAIILFEGGLTLDFHSLRGAEQGVKRLVLLGAPVGWIGSALALHYVGGLSWESSAVFGGIMIVTGPTVIAPLLRQARLNRRPAQLLQWEAIVNDPIGALAAVLAFEVVVLTASESSLGLAAWQIIRGIVVAGALGWAGGWVLSEAFRRAYVPEYMKVPVLFAILLGIFAVTDYMLHESGLLAVTVMGVVMANANLPSYTELRRFKEHATILLVSGVFILLAASMDVATLNRINWNAAAMVAVVILLVRPLTVLFSLAFTNIPFRERLLVGLTGPRGVVLVAVAGLFGERLVAEGVEDAAFLTPFAFALVAATVVLHGFTLAPLARAMGLAGKGQPGVLLAGGSQFATSFAKTLQDLEVPILITDTNRARLRSAREAGLPTFFGDVLSEAAEHSAEIMKYGVVLALSDNDAYNTLVATDLAPEFGRENVYQLGRAKQDSKRHALPASLGGRVVAQGYGYTDLASRMVQDWQVRATNMTDDFTMEDWSAQNEEGIPLATHSPATGLRILSETSKVETGGEFKLLWLGPPREDKTPEAAAETDSAD